MTDEELIARMRQVEWEPCQLAADRIEALVNEAVLSKAAYEGVSSLLLSVQQDCIKERQRAERLEAALIQMRDDRTAFRHAVHFRRFITTILKEVAHD